VERQIEEGRFLGVYEHFYATNNPERPGFGTHYVVLAYELTLPQQDWRLPKDQHGEFAWLTEAELLRSPQVHQYTKNYFLSGGKH
jgi:colanic acid biosynthesis protein WcaH